MQKTFSDMLPVELVTVILRKAECNKYKNVRLVSKEMKQIVDEDVSDIMSHLVARRKNSIAKYVQTWVAICAPLLVAITTLEEKDKDEGNRLNWEKAMKEFDTEAMVFLNEMTILFGATANDRFHFSEEMCIKQIVPRE